MSESYAFRWKPTLVGLAIAAAVLSAVALTAIRTGPVRRAVATYTALIGAAGRRDLEAARGLCTARYLQTHRLELAPEGGIVGLPRNIHPNFQAWQQDANVWICPTNRAGPVYQFVPEGDAWRFDGPVGLLRGHGVFVPQSDLSEAAVVEPGPQSDDDSQRD